MFSQNEATPLQLVNKLLAEMPWLWAVKQRWSSHHQIQVIQVDNVHFLHSIVVQANLFGNEPEVTRSYVHFEHEVSSWVTSVGVSVGRDSMQMFDVIEQLDFRGQPIESIRHITARAGGLVRVYRPKKGLTFQALFLEEARIRGGHYTR